MTQPLKTLPNDNKPDEDLDYCEYHNDRVKHFYCLKHKTLTCRVCTEEMHGKEGCAIVDLYEVDDVGEFLSQANKYNEDGKLMEDGGDDKEAEKNVEENNKDKENKEDEEEFEDNDEFFDEEG